MKEFKICIDIDSYIWKNGKVDDFGKIYVQLDDYAFPNENWTDFGRTIIGWWMQSFRKLLLGEITKVECDFMDGSYRFDITAIAPEIWQIEFIKEKNDGNEISQKGEVDAKQATKTLLEAVEKIIQLYRKENNIEAVNNFTEYKKNFLLN